MSDAPVLLMRQFLSWVDERPRSYAETMAAWRTSCPRLSVWEDTTLDGLVRLTGAADGPTMVGLTERGRTVLAAVPDPHAHFKSQPASC
jgi:hypothetical protein